MPFWVESEVGNRSDQDPGWATFELLYCYSFPTSGSTPKATFGLLLPCLNLPFLVFSVKSKKISEKEGETPPPPPKKGIPCKRIWAKNELQQKKSPKNFCDKDFAELSGELSGEICLKTLVLLDRALEFFRKFFGTLRVIFPPGARQGFGGPKYPRHLTGGLGWECGRALWGASSCNTPATHSRLRKEPRLQRGRSYPLEREKTWCTCVKIGVSTPVFRSCLFRNWQFTL